MRRPKNKETFDELYAQHHRLVRNVLFNLVGEGPLEDLTQEAFLRIWKGLSSFANRSSTKTWVYRVTVNIAMDHFRKKSIRTQQMNEAALSIIADTPSYANQQLVQKALDTLSDDHRAVAVLFYFEELTLEEIAAVMEIPTGTVKSRLHTAREALKAFLEKKGMTDVA